MKNAFDDKPIDLPCPTCGQKNAKTLKWVAANNQFTCKCGQVVTFDNSQFKSEYNKAKKSLADLEKTLKNLGKKR